MTWPKHRLVLLGIFLLGLSLRLAHFWAISQTVFPELPLVLDQTDLFANVEWARTIIAGDWLGRATYHPHFTWMRERGTIEAWYRWWGSQTVLQQTPLYPYWLAGWLALLDESLTGVLLIQLVVGALDSLVVFCLARRLFDVPVGLVAGMMTALYGPFIFHQGTLLRDWLPPILEPLALLAILQARESDRMRDWLLAGAAIGTALLAKENLFLFLPLLLLWLVVQYRRARPQMVRAGAALVLGMIVILTPVFIRNATVGAPWFSLSNRAAEGFIEGNAPDSRPVGFYVPKSLPGILERADGHFTAVVYETFHLYEGNWRAYAKLLVLKLRALADPFEIPNNLDYRYGTEISPVLRLTLTYGLIFPIGVAGIILSLRTPSRHGLLLLYGLSILAGQLVTIVLARYRLALVPVLIIYGAFALVRIVDAVRRREWTTALASTALITASAVLSHLVSPIPGLRTDLATAHHFLEYFHSAKLYGSKKEYERAAVELARMRRRAAAVPDTPENQEPKVQTISVALAREGHLRVLLANQLFDRAQRETARQMAELAKNAYMEQLHVESQYFGFSVDSQLIMNMSNTLLFFERLLAIRSASDDKSDEEAIRTLIRWLEGHPAPDPT